MAPQREWFEKDYYKTLGVSSTATAKEITSAYRKLAKKHHPDTNPGHEETFKDISAAYDVLGDADRRKEYDEVRTMGPAAGGFPASGEDASSVANRIAKPSRRNKNHKLRILQRVVPAAEGVAKSGKIGEARKANQGTRLFVIQ